LLGETDRPLDRLAVAGNHDLPRRIEVDGFDHLSLRRFRACGHHGAVVSTHDRRHRALPRGHGLLHRLRAKAHQRQRIAKRERAGGDERRVFAEAVSGEHRGHRTPGSLPRTQRRDAGGEHHRLRIGREVQCVRRSLLDQRPQVFAEHVGSFAKRIAHDRMRGKAVHHSDGLRALPGKTNAICIRIDPTTSEKRSPT
jgi:hypothetical protein